MANSTVCQNKWKPIAEPRRAKPMNDISSSPNPLVKVVRKAVIESEARTAVVQLKSEWLGW